MNLDLIGQAPLLVRLHLATVLPAFVIGTWLIFLSVKGTRPHRALGALYMGLMTITAGLTFFIRSADGGFTWLHLFIPLTLYGVIGGLWAIRRGNVAAHKRAMLSLYVGALVIAGSLTLLPGRLLHHVFFG